MLSIAILKVIWIILSIVMLSVIILSATCAERHYYHLIYKAHNIYIRTL
jgi:hypothetical protein